ncbi:MAG: flagellar basal body rod C-terminal domain-containing protein, partial [Paracoccus sp. (in: a-proteobacteria)]|nr:flagellar basal body rod C-terminal domain-containing protein [Paracoccus sp. (in: a-proteobacteria)]
TPGFAKRDMQISPHLGGGVRIDGVVRVVNEALLSETRSAAAAAREAEVRGAALSRIEAAVGLPGDSHALLTAFANFQDSINAASARPDDDLRLSRLLVSAETLADRLNAASDAVQQQRSVADQAIASEINLLNGALDRVAYLNRRISVVEADGKDQSALQDERQQIIDQIARIVPLQEVAREGGKVALFAQSGLVLLDGTAPTRFDFQPALAVGPGEVVGAALAYVSKDGVALSAAQMRLLSGGSLAGHFAVRDQLAPDVQRDLDALAFELQARLSAATVDPTIGAGPGLFTDAGSTVDPADIVGLAGRLAVNATVDPARGGQLWRLRSGINAASGQPTGDSTVLTVMARNLGIAQVAVAPGLVEGPASMAGRFGNATSRLTFARVEAESDQAIKATRLATISSRFMADGVDSDAELQKLLQYEQAYAANARVIRAIDERINQLLRT